ncbi:MULTISPECIES: hypothetical protein [Bacillus]|uniref:hypothetical protein n=1 Tax=Bacillus TaxID=1386 RepID=UPI0002FD04F1|nr:MULTISPECIES: hypothetical protein [Bacillus]
MQSILSTNLTLKRHLSVETMIALYKKVKQWEGNVFLIQHNNLISISLSKFSKFITYMLLIDLKSPIKMIFEGEKAQEFKQTLKPLLKNQAAISN